MQVVRVLLKELVTGEWVEVGERAIMRADRVGQRECTWHRRG